MKLKYIATTQEWFEKQLDERKIWDNRRRNLMSQLFYVMEDKFATHKGFEYVVSLNQGSWIAKGRKRFCLDEIAADHEIQTYIENVLSDKTDIMESISKEVVTDLPKEEYLT